MELSNDVAPSAKIHDFSAGNPLVSVVIPCYNSAEHVERAVRSVSTQSYTNVEIICVDNNSTDNTLEKLYKLKESISQLKIICEPKSGACFARNAGLKIASGEWIQFLDSDDELCETKILHQVNLILPVVDSKIGIIAGNRKWIKADGTEITIYSKYDVLIDLISGNLGHTSANLWRKFDLEKVGGWNENLRSSQEYDLLFRLIKNGVRVLYDTKILTNIYEQISGSISKKDPSGNIKRAIELRIDMREYILHNSQEKYIDSINLFFLNSLVRLYAIDKSEFKLAFSKVTHETFILRNNALLKKTHRFVISLIGITNYIKLRNILYSF